MFIYRTSLRDRYCEQALKLYQEGFSYRRISQIIPVGKSTIAKWIANFAEDLSPAKVTYGMKRINSPSPEVVETPSSSNDVQSLQEELQRLRAELLNAEIKAEAYNELINVAEAKFGIQIRKKAGAKQ